MLNEFYNSLHGSIIGNFGEDHWLWMEDESTLFSEKTAYLALHNMEFGIGDVDIFKTLRKLKIPPKVSFLLWRVFGDRIPSKLNLSKRQIHVEDQDLLCVFCHERVEDTSHVFFIYTVTQQLWWRWYNLLDFWMALPQSEEAHLWQNSNGLLGVKSKEWWPVGW